MADPPLSWPFLVRDASTLGISDRRLRGPEFRTVLRGVAVDARVPDTVVTRSRAALLLAPEGAVLSHWTAARLWGGRVPDNDHVHVAFQRRVRFRVTGVKPHCFTYRLDEVRRHGLPVTSPHQTFCQLARFLRLVDVVALGDSLVRKKYHSPESLLALAEQWVGQCRGEAVTAARLVRDGVDSSPESALRVLMVTAGFPEPAVNIEIRDADGIVRYRLDLGYEEVRVAIEYDGRWHDDPEHRLHDATRRTHLADSDGWTFVVVTADELYGATASLVQRLAVELRNAGVPVPQHPSEDWRPYFRVNDVIPGPA